MPTQAPTHRPITNVWFLMGEEVLSNLAMECVKRAAKVGAYIYIRAMDSGLVEGEKPGKVYWKVQVELPPKSGTRVIEKAGETKTWRAEGWSLDHVVREAVGQVPAVPSKGRTVKRKTTKSDGPPGVPLKLVGAKRRFKVKRAQPGKRKGQSSQNGRRTTRQAKQPSRRTSTQVRRSQRKGRT